MSDNSSSENTNKVTTSTSSPIAGIESNKDREIALEAQNHFDSGNYHEVLKLLDTLGTNRAVQHNRLITQFGIDGDVDALLSGLITSEDLDLDQQVLVDYNRALVLAKYKKRFDEAINLLETRMSSLSEPFGLIDEKLAVKLCLFLVILYIERRKDPKKALPLLQFMSEKCDSNLLPPGIQQLKAKCYLQMGSTKLAKRELKSIGGEPLLRSYLEFQRNNFKKAIKIMATITDDTNPMIVNDEALTQFGLGKKNTATFMMSKIVNEASVEILYNFGVFHLFTGNSKSALDIFHKIVPLYKKNARLWLRLAECCFEEWKKSNRKNDDFLKQKQAVVSGHVGEGIHRKLILNQCKAVNSDLEILRFARSCLNNSLFLLNSPDKNFYPSNPPSDGELNKLKISVLLASTYVNLILNDYSLALKHVHDALKLSPTGYQKVLAHLYAGEALVWLDQISEAIGHFNPEMIAKESASESEANAPSWYTNSAKSIILYNLAVAYTIRGETEKASETLRQIGATSDPLTTRQIFMLAVYLQLQQGNVDVTKTLIKQALPQHR